MHAFTELRESKKTDASSCISVCLLFSLSLSLFTRAVRSFALRVRVTALSLSLVNEREKAKDEKKREKKRKRKKRTSHFWQRKIFLFCAHILFSSSSSSPPRKRKKKEKIDDDDDEEEEEEKVASLHFSEEREREEREREREREEKRSRKWRSVSFLRALNAVLFGNTFTNEQNVQFAV